MFRYRNWFKKGSVLRKFFKIWYAVAFYVNYLFIFETTRFIHSRYSRMRSDAMFSPQSPVEITIGSYLKSIYILIYKNK